MVNQTEAVLTIPEIIATWEYEENTGKFRWKINAGPRARIGDLTGTSDGRYIVLKYKGERLYAHRVAWVIKTGEWPIGVDHINGDKTDNKWLNLRCATNGQNLRNKPVKSDSLTRIKGVTLDKRDGRFYAYIDIGERRKSLGGFDTAEEAKIARLNAEEEHHEGFSYLG